MGSVNYQLLTNSRRTSFNDCSRKHFFSYELGRRPLQKGEALRFGSLMHKALEIWWTQFSMIPVLEFFGSVKETDFNVYDIAKAKALMLAYDIKYYPTLSQLKVIAVESEFRAPLINPVTSADSRTWLLAGKLDVIIQDVQGRYAIIEHKTSSEDLSPESDYWPRLSIDGQISGYYVGAEVMGYKCDYCIYDVIKKPMLRPCMATPEDQRKYTKAGALYANQRLTDETVQEYQDRLIADISDRPDHYFARRDVVRMQEDLVDYMYDMWACGREIREAQLAGRWPRNPNACKRYGMCEYFPVCTKVADIEDECLFQTLDTLHPELELANS